MLFLAYLVAGIIFPLPNNISNCLSISIENFLSLKQAIALGFLLSGYTRWIEKINRVVCFVMLILAWVGLVGITLGISFGSYIYYTISGFSILFCGMVVGFFIIDRKWWHKFSIILDSGMDNDIDKKMKNELEKVDDT